jgi:hypothetical protein
MKIPTVPNEAAALARAEAWVAALDDGFGRAGITATDPAAAPLQDMDSDVAAWSAAVRRGWHDARSFGACARCLTWVQEFEAMQRKANRSRRSVTRALVR